MKCCRADGLIIKPSRALTSTNQNLLKLAFPGQIPGMAAKLLKGADNNCFAIKGESLDQAKELTGATWSSPT